MVASLINSKTMAIKSIFIQNILREEGRRMLSNQGRAIRKEVLFHSFRLERDRTATVLPRANGGTLEITVPHYNRILDIKKSRKKKSGKGTSNRSLRIYNRFVMGAYYSIAFRASNDFSKEVIQAIRLNHRGGGLRNG